MQIPPHEFYKRSRDEIEDKINEKYANKVFGRDLHANQLTPDSVVHKVGLCVCMYDLLKASDGLIGHGTGNVNVNGVSVLLLPVVVLSYVSRLSYDRFQTFQRRDHGCGGQSIDSKWHSRSEIESSALRPANSQKYPRNSSKTFSSRTQCSSTAASCEGSPMHLMDKILTLASDEDEKTWVWKSEEADVWFDPGTVVNVRIEQEHWQDRAPGAHAVNGDAIPEAQLHVPYSLTVSYFDRSSYRVLILSRLRLLKEDLEG